MKKFLSIIFLFALLACNCSQDELVKNQTPSLDSLTFTASLEENESRTYIEEGNLLRWTAGDQITLFDGNTLNRQYKFDGETGANAGTFSIVNAPYGSGNDLTANYAVYPFASDIASLSVIADRSSSYYNLYQKDNEIPMEARSRVTMSPFSGKFTGEGIILIATGNGV